jgi:hypothetical protein
LQILKICFTFTTVLYFIYFLIKLYLFMRRILTCLFVLFYWWTAANAVAAYPYPTTVTQPDGTTVTVKMHGDEWFHYTTTTDGYTVVKNDNGYWVYAQDVDGKLAPTTHIARDAAKRTEADKEYLQGVSLNLAPGRAAGASLHKERAKEMALPAKSPAIDLKNSRDLLSSSIILTRRSAHQTLKHCLPIWFHSATTQATTAVFLTRAVCATTSTTTPWGNLTRRLLLLDL